MIVEEGVVDVANHAPDYPLSSEYGTCKTVKALAFRSKSLNRFNVFPLRTVEEGARYRESARERERGQTTGREGGRGRERGPHRRGGCGGRRQPWTRCSATCTASSSHPGGG